MYQLPDLVSNVTCVLWALVTLSILNLIRRAYILVSCLWFYVLSEIFQLCNGGTLLKPNYIRTVLFNYEAFCFLFQTICTSKCCLITCFSSVTISILLFFIFYKKALFSVFGVLFFLLYKILRCINFNKKLDSKTIYSWFLQYLFVLIFYIFTHMETSSLPVKGFKDWHILGTQNQWAVMVL